MNTSPCLPSPEMVDAFSKLMDSLYEFVQISRQYQSVPHHYGEGGALYMAEAHLLQQIALQDGITAAELSQRCKKTASSISQLTGKLVAKGMVRREESPHTKKNVVFSLTEKGRQVNALHNAYDRRCYTGTLQRVEGYSVEDFCRFSQLLDAIKADIGAG